MPTVSINSHGRKSSTESARHASPARPPEAQPTIRCIDFVMILCWSAAVSCDSAGTAITAATVTVVCDRLGSASQFQTSGTSNTLNPACSACATAGHCSPNRSDQPGAVTAGAALTCGPISIATTMAATVPSVTSAARLAPTVRVEDGSLNSAISTMTAVTAPRNQA